MQTLEQSMLDEMVRRLVAEFKPEQIILFGSYAWGEPNDESDVDLYVIVPQSDERPIRRMQRRSSLSRRLRGIERCPGENTRRGRPLSPRASFSRAQGVQ